MNPYYIWFLIFFCIGYLIVSDASIARLFVLIVEIIKIQYEKILWIIKYHPSNPIVRFMIHHNSLRLAKELQQELKNKQEKD